MKILNNAISLGRYFVCFAGQAAGAPLVDKAVTIEKEGALRTGGGWLIRAPFTGHRPTIGLMLGKWR